MSDVMHDIGIWTLEREKLLVEFCLAGLSAGQIAGKFDGIITRNAIIGKINRMAKKGLVVWTGRGERATKAATYQTSDRVVIRGQRKQTPNLQAQEFVDLPPDESPFACTLLELKPDSCRYPLGYPGTDEFRFCGASTSATYCLRHHRLCFYRPQRTTEAERQQRAIAFKNNAPQMVCEG